MEYSLVDSHPIDSHMEVFLELIKTLVDSHPVDSHTESTFLNMHGKNMYFFDYFDVGKIENVKLTKVNFGWNQ